MDYRMTRHLQRVASPARRAEAQALGAVTTDYAELVDRVPAINKVADVGEGGRWHYVSPQIRQMLGFSAQEWCDDPGLWSQQLHREDRDRVLHVEAGDASRQTDSGALEYRIHRRDGNAVWVRDTAQLVRDADGRLRWHGVLSDITERKQAEAELEQRAAQQSAVARLGEHALEGASTSDLMQEAVSVAAAIFGVDVAAVAELLPDRDGLVLRAAVGLPMPAAEVRFATGSGSMAGYTLQSGGPVVVLDWATETRFRQSTRLKQFGIRSGLSVVVEGRGGPFGVLSVQSRAPRSYGSGDVDFLQSLANVLADALERHATEDEIRHRALHDPLTGLPNRVLFHDRLEQALARSRRRRSLAAILFLDLDRFKLVNDSLGHHVGDELLAAAAPRLCQAVRASDTVARFGGDEFAVLLEDISDEHDAIEMAQRIAAVFERPFVLAGSEHFVTTSIGIALARGDEWADELIRDADAAMYRAKDRGRARYELFDEVMRERAIAHLQVERDLRRALERDELQLVYQPVVSLPDRAIVGVEALLRWHHPQRGLIVPSDFLTIAEEAGLIEPIGRWVLDTACRQNARWQRSQPAAPPVWMAVNLSAVQVARPGLAEMVTDILRAAELDPRWLLLEITESLMLRDADALADALPGLKRIGVQLTLDDFGTGYSSLGYLTRLPIDALKVDRSFVDGLGTEDRDSAVTEAIIAMAHALSLTVAAEGVETPLQLAELTRLGCDLAQGFAIARPAPADALSRMLANAPRPPADG